jgi:hypothetical protein
VSIEESPGTGLLITKNRKVIDIAARVGRAYILTIYIPPETVYRTEIVDPELLYRRFAHLSHSSLQGIDAVTTGLPGPIGPRENYYSAYILAKAVKIINRA